MSLSAVLCAVAFAAPPPSPPTPPPDARGGTTPDAALPGIDVPDEDFIEFLGADDVGDAALLAFLKKSAGRKEPISAPPPQDAKQ